MDCETHDNTNRRRSANAYSEKTDSVHSVRDINTFQITSNIFTLFSIQKIIKQIHFYVLVMLYIFYSVMYINDIVAVSGGIWHLFNSNGQIDREMSAVGECVDERVWLMILALK